MSSFLYRNTVTTNTVSLPIDAYGIQVLGDGNVGITPYGGYAVKLINKTGAASVKGTIVETSTVVEHGADLAEADSDHPIGVVFNNGIPDGSQMWVVTSGVAEILLKNTVAANKGYWVSVSDVAGRATMAANSPGLTVAHWREVGHCLETKAGGTNVVARVALHFN